MPTPDREPAEKPALPPGLDLLWGRRERGQRGPRPGLSVDAIVEAAMRVADADGLEAVSMSRVAAEVGFTAMSLYRHIASKDELLQMMWNASAQGADRLQLTGSGWRERLHSWATVQREMIDRHPWITQMPMAAPPLAPNSLAFVERGLETLDATGIGDADKLRVIGLISSYTLSEARMAYDARRAAEAAQAAAAAQAVDSDRADEPATAWSYESLLRELVKESAYPRLHAIAWSEAMRGAQHLDGDHRSDEQREFDFGLERILDGVAALVEAAARG